MMTATMAQCVSDSHPGGLFVKSPRNWLMMPDLASNIMLHT